MGYHRRLGFKFIHSKKTPKVLKTKFVFNGILLITMKLFAKMQFILYLSLVIKKN